MHKAQKASDSIPFILPLAHWFCHTPSTTFPLQSISLCESIIIDVILLRPGCIVAGSNEETQTECMRCFCYFFFLSEDLRPNNFIYHHRARFAMLCNTQVLRSGAKDILQLLGKCDSSVQGISASLKSINPADSY